MYKDNGGGFLSPESVSSPASGATLLIGFWLKASAALISMIFLIGIHQRLD